ncbi:MAG: hypothetical protein ABJB12_09095 [Pseudomonadota bacterium]
MGNQHGLAGLAVAALCWAPAICRAQSVPFTHEGFYLQMTGGAGYLGTSASAAGEDLSIRGGAVSGSLWLGGSLLPGFVLGGGTSSAIAIRPKVKETIEGQEVSLGDPNLGMDLNMIGLISDFYPNPRRGLHVQAMLGYAVLSITQHGSSSRSPSGIGLMGGVGYDFWVSAEWSAGVLGSFEYAGARLNDVSYPVLSPALRASFTYN